VVAGRGRSRRVSLPGIAELLRPVTPGPDAATHRPASGREQHTHKITVYLSADELLDLEHARLVLRRFGITVDRGRLVREAIAVLLADLDARGEASLLARRITAQPADGPVEGAAGGPVDGSMVGSAGGAADRAIRGNGQGNGSGPGRAGGRENGRESRLAREESGADSLERERYPEPAGDRGPAGPGPAAGES
jgi:hypothetical protein